MWDFIGRTFSMLLAVDFDLPADQKERWAEVYGRSQYAKLLMTEMDEVLETMTLDDYGEKIEFGEEVMEVVRRI